MRLEEFEADLHFSTALYRGSYPEFLSVVRPVSREYIKKALFERERDNIYPAVMSETFHLDDRVSKFRDNILQVAWSILDSQGYNMDPYYTTASAMWVQNHPKTSSMDYHIHGEGNQLNAFYIIDAPEDSCVFQIHEPRSAKNILSLPIKASNTLTLAHNTISYTPTEGDLIFTNSWLPHSFTRNRSNADFNFIHVNINVVPNPDYNYSCMKGPIIV